MAWNLQAIGEAAVKPYQGKSWWADYVRAQAAGQDALKSWAQTAGVVYADFDGATDGDFVGRQVATLQDHRTNLFGINVDKSTADKISGTAILAGATFFGTAAGGALGGAFGGLGAREFVSDDKKKVRRPLSRPALEHLHRAEIF